MLEELPYVLDDPEPEYCKRHKWKTERETWLNMPGPTGHPIGYEAIWETRRCQNCPYTTGRWKPNTRRPIPK